MEPATAALIARAAIAAGTNKKVWTGIASVLAALCLPVILAVKRYRIIYIRPVPVCESLSYLRRIFRFINYLHPD